MPLRLYQLRQSVNTGYDTFNSVIVAAVDKADAITMSPDVYDKKPLPFSREEYHRTTWASQQDVKAEYIGDAAPTVQRGIILASFIAG
jgi:hypothetical protein